MPSSTRAQSRGHPRYPGSCRLALYTDFVNLLADNLWPLLLQSDLLYQGQLIHPKRCCPVLQIPLPCNSQRQGSLSHPILSPEGGICLQIPSYPQAQEHLLLCLFWAMCIYLAAAGSLRLSASLFVIPLGLYKGLMASKCTVACWNQ